MPLLSTQPFPPHKFVVLIRGFLCVDALCNADRCSMNRWEGSPSKFPWTFTAKETMFLLDGKVKVYCDGSDESFEIGAGDLVEFPKGMKVIWEVTQAVKKHYYLEK